jgi:hypothetical protein
MLARAAAAVKPRARRAKLSGPCLASSWSSEYAGTRYSGWQIQKNARTVQGELAAAGNR